MGPWVTKRVGNLGRILVVLAFGLAGSQLANFMDAYEQNLAGRLAEAERDVAGIIARAVQADLSLPDYLEAFRNAENPIFVREGAALQAKIERAAFLSDDLNAITRTGIALKPVVFAGRLDRDIAGEVWRRFTPALPIDGAGLVYTGTGLLLGVLAAEILAALLSSLAGAAGRRLRRRPAPATPAEQEQ